MRHEIDLYGVFVPDLLVLTVITFFVSLFVQYLLDLVGFYRLVWHRALFDTALFVVLLGGVVAFAHGFHA
jgi:uncharacterized protein DUF1656